MMGFAVFLAALFLAIEIAVPTATAAPEVDYILYFEATAGESSVLLEWESDFEPANLQGFYIRRTTDPMATPDEAERVSELIQASGDVVDGDVYDYTDTDVSNGVTYTYWLEEVFVDSDSQYNEPPVTVTVGEVAGENYLPLMLGP